MATLRLSTGDFAQGFEINRSPMICFDETGLTFGDPNARFDRSRSFPLYRMDKENRAAFDALRGGLESRPFAVSETQGAFFHGLYRVSRVEMGDVFLSEVPEGLLVEIEFDDLSARVVLPPAGN